MKLTRMIIKANKFQDGFYTAMLSGFGDTPRFAGQVPSDVVEAVNTIDKLVVGGQHYINGRYIEIMSIEVEEI